MKNPFKTRVSPKFTGTATMSKEDWNYLMSLPKSKRKLKKYVRNYLIFIILNPLVMCLLDQFTEIKFWIIFPIFLWGFIGCYWFIENVYNLGKKEDEKEN